MKSENRGCSFLEFSEKAVSINTLLTKCALYLSATAPHVLQPWEEAAWLLQHLLGRAFSCVEVFVLSEAMRIRLERMLFERVHLAKPLAYILGSAPFLDLEILCEAPILIPRVETESWVSVLLNELECVATQPLKILDLCAGTGCIALAIAKKYPSFEVFGVDIDVVAVALAEKNKFRNNVSNAYFSQADLFAELELANIDLVVANPPYITDVEYDFLTPGVKDWEAKHALVAADEGLVFYKKIIFEMSLIKHSFRREPSLVLEMSPWQISPVQQILAENGFNSKIIFDHCLVF